LKSHVTAALSAASLVLSVSVAAPPDTAASPANSLEEVIITATRRPEPLTTTLASATVLTRTDIEVRQYASFDRLLADVPGVVISNNGGLGKASSLFIRGAESDHSLVLINGMRAGSATLGTAAIQDIPLELIERVEIVRGPRSSVYGADALGGVVHIFTRRALGGEGLRSELTAGFGSNGTQRASAALGAGSERGDWQLGMSWLESDGTNACRGAGAPVFAGCFTDEPDDDGYRNASVSLRGGIELGAATRLDVFASGTDGRVEFDGSFANSTDLRQLAVGAAVATRFGTDSRLTAQVGRTTDDTDNFSGAAFASRFDTTRDSVSLQWDGKASEWLTLALGADYLRDQVDGTTAYVESSRRAVSVFGQGDITRGAHTFQWGLRYDDNEQFGGETTGSVGWGWALTPQWRFTATAGTAFKAPTFNELYFPGFGNPSLGPESARSYEVSARWRSGEASASLTVYQNDIDDLIGFDANFSPVNIDETQIRGVELVAQASLGGWQLGGSAEWLDPENRAPGANFGKQLPRRAKFNARADIARSFGSWTLGSRAQHQGSRFDNLANTRRLSSFTTLDLRAEWQVSSALRLQARLDNAFDESYETALFYPQPGREWHLTVRYAPGR
jgi:vitamin B12 transporter